MKKVYIGATQMMGKGIVWSLLDGHPKVHVNLVHVSIGTFLLDSEVKQWMTKRMKSALKTAEDKVLKTLLITYPNKTKVRVNIGDFFLMMYKFGSYNGLYWSAKNNVTMINNKEQNSEFTKFNFDINLFESLIEKKFFSKIETRLDVNQVISILQANYFFSRKKNRGNKPTMFIESLAPGHVPINNIIDNIKDAKILCLKRDPIALCYANMCRNIKKNEKINKSFLKELYYSILEKAHLKEFFILVNQGEFYRKKIVLYKKNVLEKYKNNKRVLFIDFDDVILNTKETMLKIAKFLPIKYDKILLNPSIEGKVLIKKQGVIGVINDDHTKKFSKVQIALAKSIYSKINDNSISYYKFFLYLNISILVLKFFLLRR